jgi:hypothetical protein
MCYTFGLELFFFQLGIDANIPLYLARGNTDFWFLEPRLYQTDDLFNAWYGTGFVCGTLLLKSGPLPQLYIPSPSANYDSVEYFLGCNRRSGLESFKILHRINNILQQSYCTYAAFGETGNARMSSCIDDDCSLTSTQLSTPNTQTPMDTLANYNAAFIRSVDSNHNIFY